MAHQYMPKILHDSHKNPRLPPSSSLPLPTNLMYGPLLVIKGVALAQSLKNASKFAQNVKGFFYFLPQS